MNHAPNAVARLRDQRIDEGIKPIQARGWRAPRCSACRVIESHCLCAWRPSVEARSGVCLIMTNKEVFKPSNTGRSEEHTSELQSLMRISYAVFCLKKKII